MRIILATLWLLVPLGFAAYHYGPGQEQVKLDHTEVFLAQARSAVQDKNWNSAIESYQKALAKLPKENKETSMRIQLEIAKAKMQNSGLPEAREDLAELISQLNEDTTISSELKEETLSTLANARYYMTYLMKLEGLPAEEWEPEIRVRNGPYTTLASNRTDCKPLKN